MLQTTRFGHFGYTLSLHRHLKEAGIWIILIAYRIKTFNQDLFRRKIGFHLNEKDNIRIYRYNKIVDAKGKQVICFDEVPRIMQRLQHDDIKMAIASSTMDPRGAKQLLSLFEWNKYTSYNELHPGRKTKHFYK